MTHLELAAEEAKLLEKILESHLSDLRMEIAGTEKFEWRQSMKREEESIKSLLQALRRQVAEEA